MITNLSNNVEKITKNISRTIFESYYGFPKPEGDEIFDIIDPGESYHASSGFKMSKRDFSEPDNLRGYALATPREIKRGDRIRYAVVKKNGEVNYVKGGTVSWVDGMLPEDVEFDSAKYKRNEAYRNEIKAMYTDFTSKSRPKYISVASAYDQSKKWSIQLSGQKVFLWRMPALTQRGQQDAMEAIEFGKEIDEDPGLAQKLIEFAKYINTAPSEELYALYQARLEEEKQIKRDIKNRVIRV